MFESSDFPMISPWFPSHPMGLPNHPPWCDPWGNRLIDDPILFAWVPNCISCLILPFASCLNPYFSWWHSNCWWLNVVFSMVTMMVKSFSNHLFLSINPRYLMPHPQTLGIPMVPRNPHGSISTSPGFFMENPAFSMGKSCAKSPWRSAPTRRPYGLRPCLTEVQGTWDPKIMDKDV